MLNDLYEKGKRAFLGFTIECGTNKTDSLIRKVVELILKEVKQSTIAEVDGIWK